MYCGPILHQEAPYQETPESQGEIPREPMKELVACIVVEIAKSIGIMAVDLSKGAELPE